MFKVKVTVPKLPPWQPEQVVVSPGAPVLAELATVALPPELEVKPM
jgi:hypothetical protein